jgi:hypothetical protein
MGCLLSAAGGAQAWENDPAGVDVEAVVRFQMAAELPKMRAVQVDHPAAPFTVEEKALPVSAVDTELI